MSNENFFLYRSVQSVGGDYGMSEMSCAKPWGKYAACSTVADPNIAHKR